MFGLTKLQIQTGLRVMREVAAANGVFDEDERELLATIARMAEIDLVPESLEPIEVDEAARAFEDPTLRLRLVQAMIVTAVIDGAASESEHALVVRYANALQVEDPRIKNLEQLLHDNILLLKLDALRRYPLMQEAVSDGFKDGSLKGVWNTVRWFAGLDRDPKLAQRYRRLGLLPEGTFGREFWAHMTRAGFAFPGEPGGLPEHGVHHDLTHVLTGYGIDFQGELELQGFYAGLQKADPFAFIFSGLLLTQLGIRFLPVAPVTVNSFDPEGVLKAMKVGTEINFDPTRGWDHWSDFEVPLVELRARYNVVLPAP